MKEQYIKQVSKLLAVSRKQKKDILRDLEEAFASAKEHGETEEQVIERLGEPSEFAAGISELNTVVKKRMKPRTIAAILCVVVVVAVLGTLSAVYAPKLFKFGNPIPYLNAAKLLNEDNHFAIVEDKNAQGMVIISDEPECHDVLEYIYQNFGVSQAFTFVVETTNGVEFDNTYESFYRNRYSYFHAFKTYFVNCDTLWDKYTVWDIPADFLDLPPNHELLDDPNGFGRMGYLYTKKRSRIIELLGEPKEVTEQGDLYYNCFGNEVVIRYDERDNVLLIKIDNTVVYRKW